MLRFYEGCYSSFCAADEGQDELVVEASMDVSSLDHPVSNLDDGVMGRGKGLSGGKGHRDVCCRWRETGSCRYGDDCGFEHATAEDGAAVAEAKSN